MRNLYRVGLTILSIILAVGWFYQPSFGQAESSRYFPESGHTVSGEFLKKYDSVSEPIVIFGYPITEEYTAPDGSPVSGIRVQYFQRARFEYHPELPVGKRVMIAPLGTDLYALENLGNPQEVALPTSPACRYFDQTKHRTCYSFLTFFEANGAVKQFGYPISPIIKINGQLVQYFEYARFEWHPEMKAGQRVHLSDIGVMYFNKVEKPITLQEDTRGEIPAEVIDLKVRSFVQSAVVSKDGKQSIFVVVLDQNHKAVQGVQVTVTLTPSSGQAKLLVLKVTDKKGITSAEIPVSDFPIGIVEVKVTVNYSSTLQRQTVTSFRVWH